MVVGLTCWMLVWLGAAAPAPRSELPPVLADEVAEVPGGILEGQLLDPDGDQMPGVEVHWRLLGLGPDAPDFATAVTDEHGLFVLPRNCRVTRPGNYLWSGLLVTAPDCAPLVLVLGQVPEFVALRMERGHEVPARVEHPLISTEAVRVRIRSVNGLTLPEQLRDGVAAQTDAYGDCRLAGVPTGELSFEVLDRRFIELDRLGQVHVRADGVVLIAGGSHFYPYRPTREPLCFRVELAGRLEGRVVYGPTGGPAAGIRIRAAGVDEPGSVGWAVTDDNGHYRIDSLALDWHYLETYLDEERAVEWTAAAARAMPGLLGAGATPVLRLIPGTLVHGQVLPAEDGPMPPWVQLVVSGASRPDGAEYYQLGPEGRFEVRVPPGWTLFSARSGMRAEDDLAACVEIEIFDEPEREMVLDLSTPEPLRGVVLGPDGQPVSQAQVAVQLMRGAARPARSLRTDANGVFELPGRFRGRRLSLAAWYGMDATPEPRLTLPDDDFDAITLNLATGTAGRVRGLVFAAEGSPATPCSVAVEALWNGQWRACYSVATDQNGGYELTCPPPAVAYRLLYRPTSINQLQLLEWRSDPFIVEPGTTMSLPIKVLAPLAGAVWP